MSAKASDKIAIQAEAVNVVMTLGTQGMPPEHRVQFEIETIAFYLAQKMEVIPSLSMRNRIMGTLRDKVQEHLAGTLVLATEVPVDPKRLS